MCLPDNEQEVFSSLIEKPPSDSVTVLQSHLQKN